MQFEKSGHPHRVEHTHWETFYCVLGHSANAEDTILAGGSAASPKAPPMVLCTRLGAIVYLLHFFSSATEWPP